MQDNVPELMEWPANSADLSPIENVWLIVKDRVEKENASTIAEFRQQIVQTWNDLDLTLLSRLIATVPQRLQACIAAGGGEIDQREYSN